MSYQPVPRQRDGMLGGLGRACYRHRRLTLLSWTLGVACRRRSCARTSPRPGPGCRSAPGTSSLSPSLSLPLLPPGRWDGWQDGRWRHQPEGFASLVTPNPSRSWSAAACADLYGPDATFLGVPAADLADPASWAGTDIMIIGAPFDGGTSHRPGARFGPQAIRFTDYLPHDGSRPHLALGVDPLAELRVADAGDVRCPRATPRYRCGGWRPPCTGLARRARSR
jgi:hypothetical protein